MITNRSDVPDQRPALSFVCVLDKPITIVVFCMASPILPAPNRQDRCHIEYIQQNINSGVETPYKEL